MKDKYKSLQRNKKAYFNYEIVEKIECGIVLEGTEVKSIRQGRVSFGDSYITVTGNSLSLIGLTIQPYTHGNLNNHEPSRVRTLLVHKQEVKRLKRKVDERGFTLVPLEIYLKGNLIKMQVGLARGKQLHDKKNAIKERDMKRDTKRALKELKYRY